MIIWTVGRESNLGFFGIKKLMLQRASYRIKAKKVNVRDTMRDGTWFTFPYSAYHPLALFSYEEVLDLVESNRPVVSLKLARRESFGHCKLVWLTGALARNRVITDLDLAYCDLNELDMRALRQVLRENKVISRLFLQYNRLGAMGVAELASGLCDNSSVTSLDLSYSSILDLGAEALADVLETNSTLMHLNLGFNCIGPGGAARLSEALQRNSTLVRLDLVGNPVGASWTPELLRNNSSLTELRLNCCGVDDGEVEKLAGGLRVNTSLLFLNLTSNGIESKGMLSLVGALDSNSTLVGLDLSHNGIEDENILASLGSNSTLTTLRLNRICLTEHRLRRLAAALESNTTLTSLSLTHNAVGDVGAAALAAMLECNSTLTSLSFGDEAIGDAGLKSLSRALCANTTLQGLWIESFDAKSVAPLAEMVRVNTSLRYFEFRGRPIEHEYDMMAEAIEHNPTLIWVDNLMSVGDRTVSTCRRNKFNQKQKAMTLLERLLSVDLYAFPLGRKLGLSE